MKQFFIKYKQIQKQHNLASTAGFTLVELLVSIALLSIMAGIGISIYAVINSSYDQSQALSLMQTQGSQVLEVIERSIRGSNRAEVISDSNCAEDLCLVIGVPSNSIEYSVNGNCDSTVYGWSAPSGSTNGSIVRYTWNSDGTPCNTATKFELFDSDPRRGISVGQLDGQEVFSLNTGSNGLNSITIQMELGQGVNVDNPQVTMPIRSTAAMRNY